jgi:hypothetical protein
MNYISKGKTVNAEYIKKSMVRFLKIFRKKRPVMSSQEWFLHGQCPDPYNRHSPGLPGSEGGALFAVSRASGLFLFPKVKS